MVTERLTKEEVEEVITRGGLGTNDRYKQYHVNILGRLY